MGNLAALRCAVGGRAAVLAGAHAREDRPTAGIGHTRWATHGGVTEANAHPHADSNESHHVVLNGIIENHVELRCWMASEGAIIRSETDAEVVAHLTAHHDHGDLVEAVRATLRDLRGHYAFVATSAEQPGLLVAARRECPLVVGVTADGHFIASAIPAFLSHTREMHEVADGEIVVATADSVQFLDAAEGRPRQSTSVTIDWDHALAEKAGYETFMLKEIHEQPAAIASTLAGRLHADGVSLRDDDLPLDDRALRELSRLRIVACGTSLNAGLLGRYLIEEWARLPVEVDVASEYRYRNPVLSPGEMVLGITQSGETADTLAAMRLARRRGATVPAVTNVMGSQATRDADGVIFTRAGSEIGVAATKTFTAQVVALALLALKLGQARGTLTADRARELAAELGRLPGSFAKVIATAAQWAPGAALQLGAPSSACSWVARPASPSLWRAR